MKVISDKLMGFILGGFLVAIVMGGAILITRNKEVTQPKQEEGTINLSNPQGKLIAQMDKDGHKLKLMDKVSCEDLSSSFVAAIKGLNDSQTQFIRRMAMACAKPEEEKKEVKAKK